MTNGPLYDVWIGDVIPMGEIHSDLDIIHNTSHFSAGASGVIRYNAAETRLEVGPSQSGWQPIVTAVVVDVFDNTGGITTSSTPIIVLLDTERYNSHPEIFDLDATTGAVRILMSGVYEFHYRHTEDTTQGSRITHKGNLQLSVAGGAFADVAGTDTYQYTRNDATLGGTASASLIVPDVKANDRYRIQVVQDQATVASTTTKINGSSILIRKLA